MAMDMSRWRFILPTDISIEEFRVDHLKCDLAILQEDIMARRIRPETRELHRWTEEDNVRILLCLQKACSEVGIKLPWDEVGSMIGPTVTGGAVQQHVAKLRIRAAEAGIPVPGPMKRGGGTAPSTNSRSSGTTSKKASGAAAKRTTNSKAKGTSSGNRQVDLTSDPDGLYGETQTSTQPARTSNKGKANAVVSNMASNAMWNTPTNTGTENDIGPSVQGQLKRRRGFTESSPALSNFNATGQSSSRSSVDQSVSNGSGFKSAMGGHVAAGAGFMDPSQSGSQTPMSRSTGVIDLTDEDEVIEMTRKGSGNGPAGSLSKIAVLKVGKSEHSVAVLKGTSSVPGALGAGLGIPSPYAMTSSPYSTGMSSAATFRESSSISSQAVPNQFFLPQGLSQFYASEPLRQYTGTSYDMPPPTSKRPRLQGSAYGQVDYANTDSSSTFNNYDFTPIPFNPLPSLGTVEYGQASYQQPYQMDPFAMPAVNFDPNGSNPYGYGGFGPVSQPLALGYSQSQPMYQPFQDTLVPQGHSQSQPTYQPSQDTSVPQGHSPVSDELQIIQYVPKAQKNNDTEPMGNARVAPSSLPSESSSNTSNGGSPGLINGGPATASIQNDSTKGPMNDEFAELFNEDTGEADSRLESSEGLFDEGPTDGDETASAVPQRLLNVQTVENSASQLSDEMGTVIFPSDIDLDFFTNGDDVFGGDFGAISWETLSAENPEFGL
ncbi:MAG: hypothetical protein Q9187_000849 [Circinaria calcarea]